ncbi:exodeoxyribonuclease III [Lysinibacillus xylanilyticus]|uniref:exodeoxyribonuclease III n=1 Tax=Lysinibacillus xylanilyticus TaxID=582475 RepID=UPI0036DF08BE
MRIISWNVNGFRSAARKNALNRLIREYSPDLLFLQELKCTEHEALEISKIYANSLLGDYIWHVDGSTIPGRHGVGMFIKEELLDELESTGDFLWIGGDNPIDPLVDGQSEARLQAFVIKGVLYVHTYTVNTRQDLSRVPQRKEYDDEIFKLLEMWSAQGGTKAVVIGDFNVVGEVEDWHGPNISPTTSGMTESERTSFKVLLRAHNLKDSFRELHPDTIKYSYWSYRGYARENNKGWRIDLALTSEDLFQQVESSEILTHVEGSDHAPIILELRDM